MLFQRKLASVIARRFLEIFEAHDVQPTQIPRLIPQIKYQDLDSPQALQSAMSPAIVDAAAKLFGVRREWLEGRDEAIYPVIGMSMPTQGLIAVAGEVRARHPPADLHAPVRFLCAAASLDRNTRVSLLPVVVEPAARVDDWTIYRCHVFNRRYDWANEADRLVVKAMVRLFIGAFGIPVPLHQVAPSELDRIAIGEAIPSILWRKSIITDPSLEDYVLDAAFSRRAKETDELPAVLAYLEASPLTEWWRDAFTLPSKVATIAAEATPEATAATSAEPAKPEAGKSKASGKRAVAEAQWAQVRLHVKAFRAAEPHLNIAEMVRKLLATPDLKLPSRQVDTIRRRIADLWPEPDARKPGRRPKKSG